MLQFSLDQGRRHVRVVLATNACEADAITYTTKNHVEFSIATFRVYFHSCSIKILTLSHCTCLSTGTFKKKNRNQNSNVFKLNSIALDLLDCKEEKSAFFSLVDIIFAFAYNKRTTLGENTVSTQTFI